MLFVGPELITELLQTYFMYLRMQEDDPIYPTVSLFNLEHDPQETTNLARDHTALVVELLKEAENVQHN